MTCICLHTHMYLNSLVVLFLPSPSPPVEGEVRESPECDPTPLHGLA